MGLGQGPDRAVAGLRRSWSVARPGRCRLPPRPRRVRGRGRPQASAVVVRQARRRHAKQRRPFFWHGDHEWSVIELGREVGVLALEMGDFLLLRVAGLDRTAGGRLFVTGEGATVTLGTPRGAVGGVGALPTEQRAAAPAVRGSRWRDAQPWSPWRRCAWDPSCYLPTALSFATGFRLRSVQR